MARSPLVALTDIQNAIDLAREAAQQLALPAFEADRIRRAATERALMTITEAVRHLPDDLLARHQDIPWADIRGIGNHLRHEYWIVDAKIVWEVVQSHLAPLQAAIQTELSALRGA